jgi:uncharacterized membrane protein YdjX (TVP38/TMEM64 family)
VNSIQNWVPHSDAFAPIIFIMVYVFATVLFLPDSIITLAGGALFGPVWGVFYNLTGATIGAFLSFLIG